MNTQKFESLESFMAAYVVSPLNFSLAVQDAVRPMFNRKKSGFPTAICRETLDRLKALGVVTPNASFRISYA